MNGTGAGRQELQALCDAAIEDRLTDEQVRRLEELVLADPEARRFYVAYLHQHGCLHWSAADPTLMERAGSRQTETAPAVLPFTPKPAKSASKRRWLMGFVVAASLLVAALAAWTMRPAAPALATLVSGNSCKWDAGSLPTEDGAPLAAGRLRLAEGVARIVFASGAEVTLEAPAELELVTNQRCVLHGGRLVAKVPPQAIGFVVDTPTAMLKDLGTEFGVNVRDAQTADVQVFNGIVDVQHRASGQTERLLTGRNRRFSSSAAADFDPLTEKPAGPNMPPLVEGARTLHLTTATGHGKDAFVQPLFPSVNHSEILLLVKNSVIEKSDYNRKAYVAFDLSAARGMKIADAQVAFTFAPTGMGFASEVPDATFAIYGLTDETLDDWDEDKVRWNTAPANRPGGVNLDLEKVVKVGTFLIAQGALQGTRSVSGPALVNFLNQDTNGLATLVLVRETLGSGRSCMVHGFANKKHPSLPPPSLKLTVVPR